MKIEQSGIIPIEYQTTETLDNLFRNFERNYAERDIIRNNKERLFENLKIKTEKVLASEDEFIKYLDSEFATLDDKQKSIDTLLKNISTQFSIPCKTLYSKFQEFEAFINNQFNVRMIPVLFAPDFTKAVLTHLEKLKKLPKVKDNW